MNTSKIIKAYIGAGTYSVTEPITQWDYGYILQIEGAELPATYRVDFSNNRHEGEALTVYGNEDGAEVPEELIATGKDIFAFYYYIGEGFGKTAYTWKIPNNTRANAGDREPTPTQQDSIDQLIVRSNEAVTSAEQSALAAGQSAQSASDDADRAERARTGAETAQGKAEEAQESAERAKDDAETSERNASESERKAKGYAETASEKADAITGLTAQATTLPDGASATASYNAETGVMSFGIPKGKDGTDGDDGYSPTANVSKTVKTATITITDKNGTTSAQVSDGTDGTDGIDGISPSVSVTDITGGHRVVITDKDGAKSFDVEDGATGATPNLTIGTVETLEPTESATATITGTPENPVLNLGIPQGDAGEVTTEEFLKAFPTDTASGSIASFSDGADDMPLKSLVVDINPVQDLSQGDPSPENICPISGWTEVDVEQSGINVWDEEVESGYFYTSNGAPASSNAAYRSKNYIPVKPNTTYFFKNDNHAVNSKVARFYFYDKSKTFITSPSGDPASRVFTVPDNAYFMRFYVNEGIENYTNTLSINYPSTDHDYHPYTGRSITINLGQTVYGGHLNVLSGELVVDRAMVDLGTLEWEHFAPDDTHPYDYFKTIVGGMLYWALSYDASPYVISSSYRVVGSSQVAKNGYDKTLAQINNIIFIANSDYTDGTTFKTAMSGVQLCYKLATPIEIQLTPNQVNSLLGQNNLWADSGDTEVVYRADTKLFIERLTAPDSADMIADANITSGQYFMVGNSLYKATANIANGSAIIVGTNCTRKSLSEALNEINA